MPQPSDRYSRQILFPGLGAEGQRRLAQAKVVVVGVGATGAATASLLARAGVGSLTLVDRDFVEHSNLQRQVLFDEQDAREGLPKAEAAQRRIAAFNSEIHVEGIVADLVPGNIEALCGTADLLLDCTDNFETRYLVNDYAVRETRPWIYAAAVGAYAAGMTILPVPPPGRAACVDAAPTACLACLFPVSPAGPVETCDTAGILGSAVNLAASIQAGEALKLLSGHPETLRRTLFGWDTWANVQSAVNASTPDPACPVCHGRTFTHLAGEARPHITLCGRNSVQIHEHRRPLDLALMRDGLAPNPEITGLRANAMLLRFTRGAHTVTVFPDGRALIQGTTDPAVARSLYARFLGA